MLNKLEQQNFIHCIKICRGAPSITHSMFVDDLMIFCRAFLQEGHHIMEAISRYSSWSGQAVNSSKSSLFSSRNVQHNVAVEIGSGLSITRHKLEGKYLGLPLYIPCSKRQAFQDINEKILKKIDGWKMTCLSQVGRCTLIKAVASALPTYCMSIFL